MSSKEETLRIRNFKSIFPDISAVHDDVWGFTFIHKAVTGIINVNLEQELQHAYRLEEIDVQDLRGRTPLHWAAFRGDEKFMKILLQAKANFKVLDGESRTPLHAAIMSGSTRCMELLLIAGSNVSVRDGYGNTALAIAVWAHDNDSILELLLLAGASVKSRNRGRDTPLQSAACLNHKKNVAFLLEAGAELETQDVNGDSPLFEAIYYNCYDSLELILAYNPRFDNVTAMGYTILHVLALYGSEKTIGLFSNLDMKDVSIHSTDLKGRTAAELFEKRNDVTGELREAFEGLWRRLEKADRIGCVVDVQEDGDNDMYFDALSVLVETN